MTREELIELLRTRMTNNIGFGVYNPLELENEYEVHRHIDFQMRKMLAQIAFTQTPHTSLTFNMLVFKSAYRNHCVMNVSRCDLQPNELNELRCKALEDANNKMVYCGYDDVAIVKCVLNCETDRVSLKYLRDCISNEKRGLAGEFLWFDFDGENNSLDTMKVFKW